ncbi:MAG: sigma 54-interacting transcriptional regulator, partial [Oscillospiraceae bacterium]|nr:sigma 54-interacting transcriptional regulator [Oscillospiraceae bacterium]
MAQDKINRMFGSPKEAYDRLRAIVDSSYDGIYITDGRADTLWVNPAYLSISGLREEDVVGRSMWDLEREGVVSQSGTLIALTQRRPVTLQQTFRTGKRALITSTPSFGDHGEIDMVVTNVRDMTDFYDLQAKYREAQERYHTEIELSRRRVLAGAELIAADPTTLAVLRQAEKVAALDATVLLTGETGVGKEQFARFIFKNSPRREGRFITVNCGAIPPSLIESELFGYEKGAFTGAARDKMGLFELADKGTLFLDEIGDLPLGMQVKLLRVLQERCIKRVGATRDIPVDVRFIAATNRDLEEMVRVKTFREDLFYRLNVVPLTIPPLRERREDIIPLADAFLEELNKKYGFKKQFSTSAFQAMEEYGWPGNVRELKNVVERMVILSLDDVIRAGELPFRPQWT